MREYVYTITDPEGIHARPAGAFVKEAAQYGCKVTIEKDGREVDAKRIMGVMSLDCFLTQTVQGVVRAIVCCARRPWATTNFRRKKWAIT